MKKAVSLPFNWMFALIVGGIILFLAIFASGKIIKTGDDIRNVFNSNEFVNSLSELETGLATGGISNSFELQKISKIVLERCSKETNFPFGEQEIQILEQSVKGEFAKKGTETIIKKQYVFSENEIVGEKINLLSKPFYFPFKVSDVIILFTEEYCFYNAPEKVLLDLEGLTTNLEKIKFVSDPKECTGRLICFDLKNPLCNKKDSIQISSQNNYETGIVKKDNNEVYFMNNLLYGAIFSDKEIYECNVLRLLSRARELSKIYIEKIEIISLKGCNSILKQKLIELNEQTKTITSSKDLNNVALKNNLEFIDKTNSLVKSGCTLYQID